jgi:FMN-dependent NADH-azoreductase
VDLEVDYLDVTIDAPAHVTGAFAIATYHAESERAAAMRDAVGVQGIHRQRHAYRRDLQECRGRQYRRPLSRQKTLFITTHGADLRLGTVFSPAARCSKWSNRQDKG